MCVLLHQGILNRPQPCNTVLDSEYVELGYLLKQWFSLGFGNYITSLKKGPMGFWQNEQNEKDLNLFTDTFSS